MGRQWCHRIFCYRPCPCPVIPTPITDLQLEESVSPHHSKQYVSGSVPHWTDRTRTVCGAQRDTPHRQVWGTHTLDPTLNATATLRDSKFKSVSSEGTGTACSHSPLSQLEAANNLYLATWSAPASIHSNLVVTRGESQDRCLACASQSGSAILTLMHLHVSMALAFSSLPGRLHVKERRWLSNRQNTLMKWTWTMQCPALFWSPDPKNVKTWMVKHYQ